MYAFKYNQNFYYSDFYIKSKGFSSFILKQNGCFYFVLKTQNWTNSELMNAMKKLIVLLESGMKFKLSDDLIKSIDKQSSSFKQVCHFLWSFTNIIVSYTRSISFI